MPELGADAVLLGAAELAWQDLLADPAGVLTATAAGARRRRWGRRRRGERAGAASRLPPGWPAAVRPPGSPDWERSASDWLLDLCPPDYRGHAVLRRHPLALARLAAHHVEGGRQACAAALASLRVDLSGDLDARTLAEVFDVLDAEQAAPAVRGARGGAGRDALRGRTYIPRL